MATGPRITGPAELVRGKAVQVAPQLLNDDGDSVATTSWSGKLYRAGVLLTSATGTTSLSWLITAAESWDLGADYQIVWELTWSGGSAKTQQAALVCFSLLYPELRPVDVYREAPAFNPDAPEPLTVLPTGTTIADIIVEAWKDVLHRLRKEGWRADRIIEPYDLRPMHLYGVIAKLYTIAAGSIGDPAGQWLVMADRYEAKLAEAWKSAAFKVAVTTTQDLKRNARPPLTIGGSFTGGSDVPWRPPHGRW